MVDPENTPRFLRHKRGRGRIYDTSECCQRTFLDSSSVVCDDSDVWSSRIHGSHIKSSTVIGATVERSWVESSLITGGKILDSAIACELITGLSTVERSTLVGKMRVADSAQIVDCKLSDLTVCGSARLIGLNIRGFNGYIVRGTWLRPPRIVRLGCGFTVTESVDGHAFVGCREMPIEDWFRRQDRYGRIFGLDRSVTEEIRQIFESWMNHQYSELDDTSMSNAPAA